MASLLISSILKATNNWLSLIRASPSTSSASSSPTTATVTEDLEKMQRMLKRIQAVLLDAEEREIMDESVKLWLKELKDVAYDAEDVMDEYHYQVLRAQVERQDSAAEAEATRKRKYADAEDEVTSLTSSSNSTVGEVSILRSLADRIKNIRKRFKEISKDRDSLHLRPEYGERRRQSSIEYPSPSSHTVDELDICGRNDEKKKLLDWLFSNDSSKFEVIAVVGMGGLGKTTLAQLVYNDRKVSDYFRQRIWIFVSNDFDLKRLTRSMIESVTKRPCTLSELSLLQAFLLANLQGEKVLLVLDDVWNENEELWSSLRNSLRSAEMVRIVVTTRNISVAEVMQTTDPYRLGYLADYHCWQLFTRRAFCGRDLEQLPNLVEIGKRIVEKCGGLPLAVKSLGGLLRHETDEDAWKDVLQSDLWELNEENNILPALKLSYNCLPSHLKPCFVICSTFPKDYLFGKDEIVKLWTAHGYIQHKRGRRIEETGHKYFNELHGRSFFDEAKWLKESFKMHDSIHDLAQYISVNECLTLAKSEKSYDTGKKIRHLFINDESYDVPSDTGTLRSVILYRITRKLPESITNLKQLRYLKLQFPDNRRPWYMLNDEPEAIGNLNCTREPVFSMPEAIGNLICLRHLELETDGTISLPKSIVRLYNMNVLKLRCHQLEELPETMGNLISLQHLVFECDVLRLPSDLSRLEVLNLLEFTMFFQLSDWTDHPFFNKLTRVHLHGCCNDRLPTLGQVPHIRYLSLESISRLKIIGDEFCRGMNSSGVAFPSLTELKFRNMSDWMQWEGVLDGDFPELQELIIQNCPKLSWIPVLPNLKTLESSEGSLIYLSPEFGEVTQLEGLRGGFRVRNDDIVGILKNLVLLYLSYLVVEKPGKFHCRFDFRSGWKGFSRQLQLVVVDEIGKNIAADYEANNQIKKTCFFILESLKPHTGLVLLHLKGCHGVGYPGWMGDPSFNKLTEVHLSDCCNDQLPTFGQLPSLKSLTLNSIARLKIIGYEFSHGMNLNAVAFPSLFSLVFQNMPDWEEWFGVLKGDFPQLREVGIHGCPVLSSLSPLRNLHSASNLYLTECPALPLDGLNSLLMLFGRISHSPFNNLRRVCIGFCSGEQLPALGQLPSLRFLTVYSISGLKNVGDEFCRCVKRPHDVAFPSLTQLDFEDMPDWEEWHGLHDGGDFLQLQSLRVEKCPKLWFFPPLSSLPPNLRLRIIDCPRLLI